MKHPNYFRLCAFAWLWAIFAAPAFAAADSSTATRWVTASGTQVFFLQANDIPMIDVAIDIDAGSRWDPPQQSGLASLTASMLDRGIRASGNQAAMTELEINEAFAALAVQFGGGASMDRASLNFRMLSDPDVREPAAQLISRLLAYPAFSEEILAREKKRAIASIQESLTQPQAIARRALYENIYAGHPYGAMPTEASINAIGAKDLSAFHGQHWRLDRMRITLVGALTESQARAWVDQALSLLPQAPGVPSAVASRVPQPMPPISVTNQAIPHPSTQSHLWLGVPAMARSDPDFFALTVGNYILGGGGFVSQLTQEIREKRGLSYSVFSTFSPLAQPGLFMIGLQTQKARAPEALQVVRETVARFLKEGPTEKELKAAKQNLVGGFALRVDTNRKLLDNLAQINFYDLPHDYLQTWTNNISAVTREDIIRAMNRLISVNTLSVVMVGGPEGATP
jgi:zinc protease